jgi:hypothetical protein
MWSLRQGESEMMCQMCHVSCVPYTMQEWHNKDAYPDIQYCIRQVGPWVKRDLPTVVDCPVAMMEDVEPSDS